MVQVHLFISGYVHSVGFRRFIQREAEKRGITGWVRNLTDRRVEAVLQGEKEDIDQVVQLARRGPMMAEVKSINVQGEDISEKFTDFSLRETASL